MRRAGRTHHKTPNLAEAFRHFFGRDPEDQQSAGGDVKSCMAIWFALRDMARRRSESANDAEAPSAA
jgi:DNA polymerase-3 subunit epsilon